MKFLEKEKSKNLSFFTSPFLRKNYGIVIAFTNNLGGSSDIGGGTLNVSFNVEDKSEAVQNNRRLILDELGFENINGIYTVRQVHGNKIILLDNNMKNKNFDIPVKADSIITSLKQTPIMVMGADCNLIIIVDINKRIAGVIHAGWKGTLNKIAIKTFSIFKDKFKSKMDDIKIFFGPSIRICCYKVDEVLLNRFIKSFGDNEFYKREKDRIFLDLPKINKINFLNYGLKDENIYDCQSCTCCNLDYFSYRRNNKTGRHCALAIME